LKNSLLSLPEAHEFDLATVSQHRDTSNPHSAVSARGMIDFLIKRP
jgi:hypothetical protein